MGIYRYPEEVHEFVRQHCTMYRDRELAEKCNQACGTNFTDRTMKCFRHNHGYKNGMKQWTKEDYWKHQKKWPPGMYEYIRDNSWGVSSKDMAERVHEKFGVEMSPKNMKQFRQRHGIKSGVTGWYQKENVPGNKGKKLAEYVGEERAAEIQERISPTQFKKGERPKNEVPVGTISIVDGRKLIKVQMTGTLWERWMHYQRYVWEQNNGPVPEGMCVKFKDNNPLNCDISNLMLVTKGEIAQLAQKQWNFKDPDLTETAVNIIRLKDKARKIRKKSK